MNWTARCESDPYCEGALGRVSSDEKVARIVIRQEPDQGYNPFQRSELLPPKKREPDNTCGQQDGLSVDRSSNLSRDQLYARSVARAFAKNEIRKANGKPANQSPEGAVVAEVERLRQISRPSMEGKQVIFIYDDALPDNQQHAVIRVSASVPDEEVALILDDIRRAFDQRVGPPGRND